MTTEPPDDLDPPDDSAPSDGFDEPPNDPEIDRLLGAIRSQLFSASSSQHDEDMVGGRYRLQRKIGAGSMATVWRAHDERNNALVALKILRSRDLCEGTGVARMLREARLAAAIDHPNCVRVLDSGEHGAGAFVAMELIEGEPLGKFIAREGPVPWVQAQPMLVQIAEALAAAHACGVVHRDLKPANILVTGTASTRVCKVIDFGLARPLGVDPDTGKLTGTGLIFGSPGYMSPEQVRGTDLDLRSDVYAFGCLAYELVTGVPLVRAETPGDALIEHLTQHPLAFAEVAPELEIPEGVEAIVLRATRKDRELRFADMTEVRSALLAVDRGELVRVPDETLMSLTKATICRQTSRRMVAAVLALAGAVALGMYTVIT